MGVFNLFTIESFIFYRSCLVIACSSCCCSLDRSVGRCWSLHHTPNQNHEAHENKTIMSWGGSLAVFDFVRGRDDWSYEALPSASARRQPPHSTTCRATVLRVTASEAEVKALDWLDIDETVALLFLLFDARVAQMFLYDLRRLQSKRKDTPNSHHFPPKLHLFAKLCQNRIEYLDITWR